MTRSAKLRNDIRRAGVPIAEIARRAGISITTLHSFVSKDGAEMRASNFEKVASVVADMKAGSSTPAARPREVREEGAAFDAGDLVRLEIAVGCRAVAALRKTGQDVEAIARVGAEKALKEAEAKAWAEANREATDAYNKWIEKHGTLAEQLGLI